MKLWKGELYPRNQLDIQSYVSEIAGMKIGIVNIMVNDETDYASGCMHSPYLLK